VGFVAAFWGCRVFRAAERTIMKQLFFGIDKGYVVGYEQKPAKKEASFSSMMTH
jgi:hypothetical protein